MIRVRVPATSANMGPGFDALGIALNLYNEYEFEELNEGLEFEGFEQEFCDEDNIIYKSMLEVFKLCNYKPKGLKITLLKQDIPIARGLGSSSSCIVAGLVGANNLIGKKLTKNQLLDLAVSIEGHPDNVAPALLGGIVIAVTDNGKTVYEKIENKNNLNFVAIVPNFKLKTETSREVLPKKLTYADSVYNIGRVALLAMALNNGNNEILRVACNDRLHEPYRNSLIKGFDLIKKEAYNNGALASYLSGAGPTIMAIVENLDNFNKGMKNALYKEGLSYDIINLSMDKKGANILEGGNKWRDDI